MALSRRIRFEILRRDDYACRYCGGRAPDVALTVDHVVPVALGGSDDPTNLTAACQDCNAGKSSTSPNAETVADVSEAAERWARAIAEAARRAEDRSDDETEYLDYFDRVWHGYTTYVGDRAFPLSLNWEATLLNYRRSGLTHVGMVESIKAAMNKTGIAEQGRFPYFCGVARNKVQAITEAAAQLIEDGEV